MDTFLSCTQVSIFPHAKESVPSGILGAYEVLESIGNGQYKDVIEKIRLENDKKKRAELKKQLPAVTWSGLFKKRNANSLERYSGIICHDVDNLDSFQIKELKASLITDPYVLSVFVSPSGNGLKILFETPLESVDHLIIWEAIGQYLNEHYDILPDPSCKDICRLCFLSYDPDIFIRLADDPVFIDGSFIEDYTVSPVPKKALPIVIKSEAVAHTDYIAKCHEIVTKTVQPMEGSFNAYINQFAIHANRYAIDEMDCAHAIAAYCGWSNPDKEDMAVIRSVYNKMGSEKGKYLQGNNSPNPAQTQTVKPKEATQGKVIVQHEEYDESVLFWYIVGRIDKVTGKVQIDEKTQQPLGEYKYSYDDAITFLQNNGFYKYRVGAGYQFVQVDKLNKHVEIVDELRIKEFMIEFLKSKPTKEFKRVRELFRRGAKNYCSTGILEGMDYYRVDLTRDTSKNAYIYFNNCFLDISKEGIAKKEYTQQQGFIWKRQMLDFDYYEVPFEQSDVNLFVWYASTGRKLKEGEERTPEEIQKYRALCTTIGYTLHRYKSPTLTKAIITTDKKLRSTGENNGRSGKSLIIKLISKMLNVVTIDGRNFSFDKDFNFQKVNVDTALINFDDVKPNFDFSRLFSMITEEFSFEKKRIDLITIPFSDAPKFWISSNSTLKGGGESAIARQQIIEFSSYFNSNHQPATEFGRMFFFEWDTDEWQRYYSFMVNCVKMYLEHGLIDFPLENYGLNKLIDTAGEEFVDYMDETVLGDGVKLVTQFDSKVMYDTWLGRLNAKYPPKKNTFSKYVKMWAELHDLDINKHKEDGRDRRNGIDYLIFTPIHQPAATTNDGSDKKLPF